MAQSTKGGLDLELGDLLYVVDDAAPGRQQQDGTENGLNYAHGSTSPVV